MRDLFRPSGEGHRESVTTSSASQVLNLGTAVRVANIGTAIAYIKFGDETVTAANTDIAINVGGCEVFDRSGYTHIAHIGDANTTLSVYTGEGR